MRKRDVGYVLRLYRAERDWTMTTAAKRFGINASYWSLLESGHRHAAPELAQRLSKATGAPLELFLGLQDSLVS